MQIMKVDKPVVMIVNLASDGLIIDFR